MDICSIYENTPQRSRLVNANRLRAPLKIAFGPDLGVVLKF